MLQGISPPILVFLNFLELQLFIVFPPYARRRTCGWRNYLLRIDLGYMLSRLFITKPKFEAVKHKLLSLNQRLLSDWPLVFISTSFNFCFEEYKFSLTNGANSGFGRYFILSVKLQFLCSARLFPILEHYIVYLLLNLLQLIAFLISNCWENHCIPTSQSVDVLSHFVFKIKKKSHQQLGANCWELKVVNSSCSKCTSLKTIVYRRWKTPLTPQKHCRAYWLIQNLW